MRASLIGLVVLSAALSGCDFFWHGGVSTFENVEEAGALGVAEPGAAVFNDADAWEAFWHEHVALSPAPPPPSIDFERRTAVGLFWGEHSGCRSAVEAVERVRRKGPHAAEVEVGALPDLGPCDAIVYPVQVITFRKAWSVEFVGDVPG